jgi:hypothetical protein
MTKPKRQYFISFRVSVAELDRIDKNAKALRINKSHYIRSLLHASNAILDPDPEVSNTWQDVDEELSKELSKVIIF